MAPTQRMGGATMAAAPPTAAIPGYGYGPGEQPPRGNRRRVWLWVIFGLVVLAAVIAVAYLLLAGGGKTYAVPDVTNLTQQQANNEIVKAHLQPQDISKTSSTVAKGHVISTDPSSGTLLKPNSVVKVFVSAGQKQVSVPNVVGDDVTNAQNKLTNLGLNPVVKTDNTSTQPQGTVVRQNPTAGNTVNPGSKVTIYVSGGGVKVQDVVGDPVDTAKSILENQGFDVKIVQQPGPGDAPSNTVYAQNPVAGTTLATGSKVTIYVQPPQPSTSPSTTPSSSPSGTPSTSPPGQHHASP
jgi:eukaryotic-like serine/threonine-protein kinase